MKSFALIFIISVFILGCKSNNSNDAASKNPINNQDTKNLKNNEKYWQELIMHEIKDNKGVVNASIPLPESWKLNTNGFSISGPNNIRVKDYAPQSFMMNYDPSLQYAYAQTPMRSMPEIGQLIQEDIVPGIAKQGFTYIKHYELPEISKLDKWYSDQLYKSVPMQTLAKAYGIDVKDKEGNPALVILHINQGKTSSMENWYYFNSIFQADKNVFETAKKQLLFGLANMRYNLEPIMAYNKAEAQRIGQSWAAFSQQMAANQAAFEAQQRNHINKVNAVNDAIMSNWDSKNKAMDKNQEQFLDVIYERQNVQNSETGEKHKVEYGYNKYWMNSDGQYIATESPTYNPNADENMNQQKWQELNKIK